MIKRALILADGSTGGYTSSLRSLGPTALREKLSQNDWEYELIEHTLTWGEKINSTADTFFKGANKKLLIFSTSVGDWSAKCKNTIEFIKDKFPDTQVIIGGIRGVQKGPEDEYYRKYFDAVFLGRAMEMFDAFLKEQDITKYIKIKDAPYLINHVDNFTVEKPIASDYLKDSDFVNDKDVVGFELGLGCKFNCTFCNFPYRNFKDVILLPEDAMVHSMQSSYDRFGIKNFFVADDTANEDTEKLKLLVRAVKRLSFTPNIGGFVRLDVISKKPEQIQLLKEANFMSFFFGVETFNDKASKIIRKKHSIATVKETLRKIKQEIPHGWSSVSCIMGLEGDDVDSMFESLMDLIKENLIQNVEIASLNLKPKENFLLGDGDFYSDMEKDPEKFGIKLESNGEWKNSKTSLKQVKEHFDRSDFKEFIKSNYYHNFNGFTYLNLLSLELVSQYENADIVRDKLSNGTLQKEFMLSLNREISKYISKKNNYIQEHYGT